jgi:hypothetical protein
MPAVISRTIVWEVSSQLHGKMLMYVDDIFGVCNAKHLRHDMEGLSCHSISRQLQCTSSNLSRCRSYLTFMFNTCGGQNSMSR